MRKIRESRDLIIDYEKITLSINQKAWVIIKSITLIFIISYLFYDSLFSCILLSPLCFLFLKRSKKQYQKKRLWNLNLQFKEALGGILAALTAGYSIENSFKEAQKDLLLIYSEDKDIIRELTYINNQIRCNQRVEELLMDFANRSHLEDIRNFTEVFVMAKRSGGNLVTIINQTVRNISDKIEIKREIQTLIAGKQMEAKIMSFIPIGIIAYMRIFSPGFMDVLYHNILGISIMTTALLLYGLGVYLAEKIVDIEV